ncbi:MAG TPA: hypothetical protein VGP68_19520 [Gemmataceae bacterium]|nr:hypothetical protein [Gemmataceae bacterium]
MPQRISILVAVFVSLLWIAAARADHFTIDLEVKSGKTKEMVHAETLEPGAKAKARAVLEVPTGQEVEIHWTVTCSAKQGMFKDVLVHFFIAKEGMIGQPGTPKIDKDAAAESALTMDFRPNEKAKGQMKVKLTKPGPYLLRLETIGASKGTESHEHFAALDLLVK